MLEHGGHLRRVAESTGTLMEDWLDLSSGISPHHWPIPEPPPECWHRLPEDDDGLHQAAARYYGAPHLLPLPGTQAAIQLLPRLRPPVGLRCSGRRMPNTIIAGGNRDMPLRRWTSQVWTITSNAMTS